MAEKKWSDYWGKYKSGSIHEKESFNKTKINNEKKQRSTLTISPSIPKISKPNIDFTGIIMIFLTIALLGLGFWQSRSARIIGILEENTTDLGCQLGNCTEQLQSVNDSLSGCNSNLENCNKDLTKKIADLNLCERDRSSTDKDYKSCKDDLLQYKRDYDDVKDDYDSCKSAYDNKKDELTSKTNDYDEMKDRFENFCNDHCSGTCTWDSGDNEYNCESTTTTTVSTTTTTTV